MSDPRLGLSELDAVIAVARRASFRQAAIDLAAEIASHPSTCMRNDRASAISQWSLSEEVAMAHELELGLQTIGSGETSSGAARFRAGEGRHGEAL